MLVKELMEFAEVNAIVKDEDVIYILGNKHFNQTDIETYKEREIKRIEPYAVTYNTNQNTNEFVIKPQLKVYIK